MDKPKWTETPVHTAGEDGGRRGRPGGRELQRDPRKPGAVDMLIILTAVMVPWVLLKRYILNARSFSVGQ